MSFEAVARKVEALNRDLDGGALRRITSDVLLDAKRDVEAEVVRDLGPDKRMSGWGKFRFSAGYDLINDHSGVLGARPAGPWNVLERGRRSKEAGLPKRKRSKVYRTPYGLRTATKDRPFRVGSTRGHRTWTIAVKRIEAETPGRIHKHTVSAIARHFGRG